MKKEWFDASEVLWGSGSSEADVIKTKWLFLSL
jgi:hypothetical protein